MESVILFIILQNLTCHKNLGLQGLYGVAGRLRGFCIQTVNITICQSDKLGTGPSDLTSYYKYTYSESNQAFLLPDRGQDMYRNSCYNPLHCTATCTILACEVDLLTSDFQKSKNVLETVYVTEEIYVPRRTSSLPNFDFCTLLGKGS